MKAKLGWHRFGTVLLCIGSLICLISGISMTHPGKKKDAE